MRGERHPRRRPTPSQEKMRRGARKDQPELEAVRGKTGLRWAMNPLAFVGRDGMSGGVSH